MIPPKQNIVYPPYPLKGGKREPKLVGRAPEAEPNLYLNQHKEKRKRKTPK